MYVLLCSLQTVIYDTHGILFNLFNLIHTINTRLSLSCKYYVPVTVVCMYIHVRVRRTCTCTFRDSLLLAKIECTCTALLTDGKHLSVSVCCFPGYNFQQGELTCTCANILFFGFSYSCQLTQRKIAKLITKFILK